MIMIGDGDDEGEQGPRMLRAVPRLPLPEPFFSFHKHPNSHNNDDDDDDSDGRDECVIFLIFICAIFTLLINLLTKLGIKLNGRS